MAFPTPPTDEPARAVDGLTYGGPMDRWPDSPTELRALQRWLAAEADAAAPAEWDPRAAVVGACALCVARPHRTPPVAGPGVAAPGSCSARSPRTTPAAPTEHGWAGAAVKSPGRRSRVTVVAGPLAAPYQPGLLALREGPLRAAALAALPQPPEVVLVDATGRDHPRRVGLALHLGAALELPTVGVTDRPLVGHGPPPARERGAWSPLTDAGEVVGALVRTRADVRPVAVSAGWRVRLDDAVALVLRSSRHHRSPQPLREARRAARDARGRWETAGGRSAG